MVRDFVLTRAWVRAQIVKKGTEKVVATGTLDLAQIATKGLAEFKVAN